MKLFLSSGGFHRVDIVSSFFYQAEIICAFSFPIKLQTVRKRISGSKMQCAETTVSSEVVNAESQLSKTGDSSEAGSCSLALSSSTAAGLEDGVVLPRGNVVQANALGMETTNAEPTSQSSPSSDVPHGTPRDKWRFQVRLENGQFTTALKDALLRDLNMCLYSSAGSSFIPSFMGCGLRFGVVWFSPDDERSYNWLIEKLSAINEKAGEFRFTIEPFAAHKNKVCISLPWDSKEGLRDANVLKRLKFQNPKISTDRWKVFKSKISNNNKLLFCSIDDTSLNLLQQQNFRLNYGFSKVQVDVLLQKNSGKPSKI